MIRSAAEGEIMGDDNREPPMNPAQSIACASMGRQRRIMKSVSRKQVDHGPGPFGVIGGLSSFEAGWYEGPFVSLHNTFASASRRYRSLEPKILKSFEKVKSTITKGIEEGWLVSGDGQQAVLVIVTQGDDGRAEVQQGFVQIWTDYGGERDGEFDEAWADFFPDSTQRTP